jgi:hypothetical protein
MLPLVVGLCKISLNFKVVYKTKFFHAVGKVRKYLNNYVFLKIESKINFRKWILGNFEI